MDMIPTHNTKSFAKTTHLAHFTSCGGQSLVIVLSFPTLKHCKRKPALRRATDPDFAKYILYRDLRVLGPYDFFRPPKAKQLMRAPAPAPLPAGLLSLKPSSSAAAAEILRC